MVGELRFWADWRLLGVNGRSGGDFGKFWDTRDTHDQEWTRALQAQQAETARLHDKLVVESTLAHLEVEWTHACWGNQMCSMLKKR